MASVNILKSFVREVLKDELNQNVPMHVLKEIGIQALNASIIGNDVIVKIKQNKDQKEVTLKVKVTEMF